jgi:Rod binding domain-containing protein
MKVSQAPLNPLNNPNTGPDAAKTARNVSPEMREAAQGLESVFTQQMMKVMRSTVEPSEFSLHNSASDIYQGMLDQEYSDIAAKQNSLGLSEQIIDYWLRDKPNPQYSKEKGEHVVKPGSGSKSLKVSKMSTGGTHEDQSNE